MRILTNQIWHPQLEMIAGSLTSHRKDNHGPRCAAGRSVEIDQLVEAAGSPQDRAALTDEWGIFTVSLAQKIHVLF